MAVAIPTRVIRPIIAAMIWRGRRQRAIIRRAGMMVVGLGGGD